MKFIYITSAILSMLLLFGGAITGASGYLKPELAVYAFVPSLVFAIVSFFAYIAYRDETDK